MKTRKAHKKGRHVRQVKNEGLQGTQKEGM